MFNACLLLCHTQGRQRGFLFRWMGEFLQAKDFRTVLLLIADVIGKWIDDQTLWMWQNCSSAFSSYFTGNKCHRVFNVNVLCII